MKPNVKKQLFIFSLSAIALMSALFAKKAYADEFDSECFSKSWDVCCDNPEECCYFWLKESEKSCFYFERGFIDKEEHEDDSSNVQR